MRRFVRALPVGIALSLVAAAASAAPTRGPDPPPSGCAPVEPGTQAVRVRWATPARTRTCFFFSGPGDLGRDDHLGARAQLTWRGSRVTLDFGGPRFTGTVRGDAVTLERRSTHEFGRPWQVTERIVGRLGDVTRGGRTCRGLRAHYRYEECPVGGDCPGDCTIDADLTVSR